MLTTTAILAAATWAANPVAIGDARAPADYLRQLPARSTITVPFNTCPEGYVSHASAYRWNGDALPGQTYSNNLHRMRWGRVSFDGVRFRNHYHRPVIVAGWCDDTPTLIGGES